MHLYFALGIFASALFAGTFGALLGLGGGLILIPVLTMIFDVPIKEAIATSLVCVVATSTSAAVVYVEKHYANIRLGMLLEVATTIGALCGGLVVVLVSPSTLAFMFAALVLYTAFSMVRKSRDEDDVAHGAYVQVSEDTPPPVIEEHISNGVCPYTIRNIPTGMGASLVAGAISGLLGVGGGIIKVPVMRLSMGVPMRVAIATSNFMIGVTAATSALIYYSRGLIDQVVTVPAALGVFLGAQFGTRLVRRVNVKVLNWLFVVVMLATAVEMVLRGLKGGG